MLSNPLHRFSAYNNVGNSNMATNGAHINSNHMHTNNLDALAHNSHYSMNHLHQSHVDVHQQQQQHLNQIQRTTHTKHRQHPYSTSSLPGLDATGMNVYKRTSVTASGAAPIRRRISRACDQCNQLRTKCDGQTPCAHCVGE